VQREESKMNRAILVGSIVLSLFFGAGIHSQPVVQNLSASPSFRPLIATQQEVRQFFENYVERYKEKDVNGFLGLFSAKAIQNGKKGLAGIGEIYRNFFNRSQTLGYRLDESKMEIYENAVEVKGRYEIEQVLKRSGERKIWKGQARWVLIKEGGILKVSSIDYKHDKTL
jgi:hypothetical protein